MLWRIKHTTRYCYSGPVYCEPLTVRLRPRDDAVQRLLRHAVLFDPEPVGISEVLETSGHVAHRVWFEGLTCYLTITSLATVETLPVNPFQFVLEPAATLLPVAYSPELSLALTPYLGSSPPEPAVAKLAESLVSSAQGHTLRFVCEAAAWLAQNLVCQPRNDGPPLPAAETLARGRGSCRDLAVLYNALCRSAGLAARFVSGYHLLPDDQPDHELHAWSEVYLPGGGWRGFDPSTGLAVTERHLALAASHEPAGAAATSGSFRGTGITSILSAQIVIRATATPHRAASGQETVCAG